MSKRAKGSPFRKSFRQGKTEERSAMKGKGGSTFALTVATVIRVVALFVDGVGRRKWTGRGLSQDPAGGGAIRPSKLQR